MKKSWLALALLLSGNHTIARSIAHPSPLSEAVIPVNLVFDNLLTFDQRVEAQNLFSVAVLLTSQFPPTSLTNHIFVWNSDPALLNKKSLTIIVAPSHSPYAAPKTATGDIDAFTFTHIDKTFGSLEMFTVLIVDKLFVLNGAERFVRLLTALAHELYGNVTRHLGESIGEIQPFNEETRRKNEIASFRISVEFLRNFLRSPRFQALPGYIRDEFSEQLEREKTALRWWESHGGGSCLPRL